MERIPAAGAVVTDDQGRVLLVQRGKQPQLGRWSVPGGSVEPGEGLAEAAAREVLEETGLVVEVGRELWVVDLPGGPGRTYEVHDFAARVIGGTLQAGDDAADARWFAVEELDDLPVTEDLLVFLARAGIRKASLT